MTDKAETDRVTGEIAQLREWTSGKGYFMNLTGDTNDYYGFGGCRYAVGSEVTMDVKEGTGTFSDKIQVTTIKAGKPKAGESTAKETNVKKAYDGDFKDAKAHYMDKQQLIVQQSSMKAAAEIVAAGIKQGFIKDLKSATEAALTMKDKFYYDIATSEGMEKTKEENGE